MTRFTTAAVAAIIALAASAGAHAQTGFYVTGSLGTSKARDAGIKNDPDSGDTLLNRGASLNDLDRSTVWGAGVGYRFSPLYRADLTFSMRNGLDLSDSEGNSASSFRGRNDVSAKIKSRAVFLTGYVDTGSLLPSQLAWVNPYVGFGLGYAANRVGELRTTNTDLTLAPPTDATVSAPSGSARGIAWQVAAGVGFDVTSSLTVDVGYRYVDLGRIKVDRGTYDYRGIAAGGDPVNNGLKGDLRTHEIVVGLRYSF